MKTQAYDDEKFMLVDPIEIQPEHRPFDEGFLYKQTVLRRLIINNENSRKFNQVRNQNEKARITCSSRKLKNCTLWC